MNAQQLEALYDLLTSQKFTDWYEGRFMNHIACVAGCATKPQVMEDLAAMTARREEVVRAKATADVSRVIEVTSDKVLLTRAWDEKYAEAWAGKRVPAEVRPDGWAYGIQAKFPPGCFTVV